VAFKSGVREGNRIVFKDRKSVGQVDGTGNFVGESECCALSFVYGPNEGFLWALPLDCVMAYCLKYLQGFLLFGSHGGLLVTGGILVG
jgi:hypothetical protein